MSLDLACDPKQGNLRAVRFCEIYLGVLSRSLIVERVNSAAPLGDVQVSAALVPPQPAESDGALDTGAELLATAASRQKWFIDAFDEDTAILRRLPFAISTILRAAASGSAKGCRSTNFMLPS